MTETPALGAPCICGRLRRASRALTRRYDEALAPVGLTVTQFSVLRTLQRMGEPSLTELAETTAHEKSGLWRTIQPLIRAGWVRSQAAARSSRLALTAEGAALLAHALPRWTEAQTRVHDTLGDRRERLLTLLTEIEALA